MLWLDLIMADTQNCFWSGVPAPAQFSAEIAAETQPAIHRAGASMQDFQQNRGTPDMPACSLQQQSINISMASPTVITARAETGAKMRPIRQRLTYPSCCAELGEKGGRRCNAVHLTPMCNLLPPSVVL